MNKGALTWVNEPFRSSHDYMLCKMYSKWHFEIFRKLENILIHDLKDAKIKTMRYPFSRLPSTRMLSLDSLLVFYFHDVLKSTVFF